MANIPEIVINGTTYDLKDKRVEGVKSGLKDTYDCISPIAKRFFPIGGLIENTWINNNGVDVYSEGWAATDYLEFDPNHDSICVYTGVRTNWVFFYDSSKTLLTNVAAEVGENWYSIPSGSKYIRVSNTNAGMETLIIYDSDKTSPALSSGYLLPNHMLSNIYINSYGAEASYDGWSATDFIEIPSAYNKIIIDAPTQMSWNAFYNASKEFIKREPTDAGVRIHDIPTGAKYIRLSGETESMQSVKVYGDGAIVNKLLNESLAKYPIYYNEHITNKVRIINQKIAGSNKKDSFVFITDIHYPSNAMNSPNLIEDICKKTGITTVHLNGDYINKENEKAEALLQINKICGMYQYTGVDTFITVGNHEYNNPSGSDTPEALAIQLSQDELRWPILNRNRKKITIDPDSLSYYYDNEEAQIRYFVGTVGRGTSETLESQKFIASELLNVPEEYGVVIIYHTMLTLANSIPALQSSAVDFSRVLDAAKNKTEITFAGETYDYTEKEFELICALCGDYHLDMDYTTSGGVKIIMTTCDCWGQQWSYEDVAAPRQTGTYEEQAFDVVTIDREHKKIIMTRIGYGNDREYTYE